MISSQTVSGARRPWPGVVRMEAERAETSAKAGGAVYESRPEGARTNFCEHGALILAATDE